MHKASENLAGLTRRAFAVSAGAFGFAPAAARAQAVAEPPGDPRLSNHRHVDAALRHLQARQWADLAALVRGETPDGACVLLDDLSDRAEVDLDLSGLERQRMGRVIAGALRVNWGWRYRGTGFANTVTPDMLAAFYERLDAARQDLEAAIDRDRNDGVAFAFLIRTLKGLSGLQALESVWEDFQAAGRRPVRGYSGYADALSAKWFGSHEIMLGFARTYQRALEPASHALIPHAYHEAIFSLWRNRGLEAAVGFAAQDSVAGEVAAVSEAFLAAPASADYYNRVFAHAQFSFFFGLLGLDDLARPHMVAMGHWIGGPWAMFDDAPERIARYRAILGLSAT